MEELNLGPMMRTLPEQKFIFTCFCACQTCISGNAVAYRVTRIKNVVEGNLCGTYERGICYVILLLHIVATFTSNQNCLK